MTKLPWPALLVIAATGVAMGALSLYGLYPPSVEFALWTALLVVVWIPLLAFSRPARPLLAGLVAGALAGLGTGAMQAAFQGEYLKNVDGAATQFAGQSGSSIALYFLGFALVIGLVWGLLAGAGAWGVQKWRARAA